MNPTPKISMLVLLGLFLAVLAGCNLPQVAPSEEAAATLNVTQAYQTVQARLTQAVTLTPPATVTATLPPSQTPAPTTPSAPATSPAVTVPVANATSTKVCDQAAPGNPIDVTIPDDTRIDPGKAFTKTWRLVNAGSCSWTKDYTVALFSGDAMSAATSIPLAGQVAPGQAIDISVDMVAPVTSGTYQGNWKLRNAGSAWFGIGPNGSAPFWVRIVVQGTITATLTATSGPTVTPGGPTDTPTPTLEPTETPVVLPDIQVRGSVSLNLGEQVDLDSGSVGGSGSDLAYEGAGDGFHALSPVNGASMQVYYGGQPEPADCRGLALGSSGVRLEDLSPGAYICFRTGGGLLGWVQPGGIDPARDVLTLQNLTWNVQ